MAQRLESTSLCHAIFERRLPASQLGNTWQGSGKVVFVPICSDGPTSWPGESGRRDHRRGLVPSGSTPAGSWVTCQLAELPLGALRTEAAIW